MTETLVRRVLRVYDRATEADRIAGALWYGQAHDAVADLAERSGRPLVNVAAAVAHLSPRTSWRRNMEGAEALVIEGRRMVGVIGANYTRAVVGFNSDDPASTFGPRALKTRRFFENILGDHHVVTVDVWAMRVVGMSETELKRVGNYHRAERAFQAAARRRAAIPAEVQATTWVTVRNGRSS